jgi:hypothetical protein
VPLFHDVDCLARKWVERMRDPRRAFHHGWASCS